MYAGDFEGQRSAINRSRKIELPRPSGRGIDDRSEIGFSKKIKRNALHKSDDPLYLVNKKQRQGHFKRPKAIAIGSHKRKQPC